jgi:hypothetical protein
MKTQLHTPNPKRITRKKKEGLEAKEEILFADIIQSESFLKNKTQSKK